MAQSVKVVTLVITKWSMGEFKGALPKKWTSQGLTFAQMYKQVHHRYDHPSHPWLRYWWYTDGLLSEPDGTERETNILIQFLLFCIKQKGGFVDYINESGRWRIDAMGGIDQRDQFLTTTPDEPGGVPGKICYHCGVPNLFTRRDIKPSYKEWKSKAPNADPDTVCDDSYRTEDQMWYKSKTGHWMNHIPVAWRCRFCFSDLDYKPSPKHLSLIHISEPTRPY